MNLNYPGRGKSKSTVADQIETFWLDTYNSVSITMKVNQLEILVLIEVKLIN